MAANDSVARLQRLAEQAEQIRAAPAKPVRKAPTVAEALSPQQSHVLDFSNPTRNLILGLAAVMAVVTWHLTNSFHGHLPTNAMHHHQWTDVTAHFQAHPHAAAAADPQGYTQGLPPGPGGLLPRAERAAASLPKLRPHAQQRPWQPQPQQPAVPLGKPSRAASQPVGQSDVPQVVDGQQQRPPERTVVPSRGTGGGGLSGAAPLGRAVAPLVPAQHLKPSGGVSQQGHQQGHVKGGAACYGRGSCGLHGECHAEECVCTVTYTGPHCEHPVELPRVLQAEAGVMGNWSAAFEGEMILNQRKMASRSALTVHLPGKEDDPDHGWRVLIGNSAELKQLNDMLPKDDAVLRGEFYHSCAVIGSSGIVLNYEHGEEIDQHDMVFRFNSAPTRGFEKHVGSKTTHRITNTQNWGFHERDTENLLIHFRAKSAIKGLFWNQAQKKKLRVFAFDPEFVEYMAFSLDFLATSGLYGIVLAMHRCARVDLYGFQVSTEHGALYHYYDVCDVPANVGRDDSEYQVVRAFAKAGLVHFQEPCIIECHDSALECSQCKEESGFTMVKLPSDAKCTPGRVSRGHLEVPWRRDRHKHKGHGRR